MAVSEGAKLKESNMQFVVSKQNLQRELAYVQGVVEKKNTIPVLSNILIESVGENNIRLTGTDLDVTIRCDMDAEVSTAGSICVQARKLFEIARLLPDAPVTFKRKATIGSLLPATKQDSRWLAYPKMRFPKYLRPSQLRRSYRPRSLSLLLIRQSSQSPRKSRATRSQAPSSSWMRRARRWLRRMATGWRTLSEKAFPAMAVRLLIR